MPTHTTVHTRNPPEGLSAAGLRAYALICERWEDGLRKPNLSAVAAEAGINQSSVSRLWKRHFLPHLQEGAKVRGRRPKNTPPPKPRVSRPEKRTPREPAPPRERKPVSVKAPLVHLEDKPTKIEDVARGLLSRASQWDDLQRDLIVLERRRIAFLLEKLDEDELPFTEAARLAGPSFANAANRAAWASGNCAKVAQELAGDGPAVLIVKEAAGLATKAEASEYDSPATDD